jgi:hypothetical protein
MSAHDKVHPRVYWPAHNLPAHAAPVGYRTALQPQERQRAVGLGTDDRGDDLKPVDDPWPGPAEVA